MTMKRTSLLFLVFFIMGLIQSTDGQVISYGARLGMAFPGFQDEEIGSQRITVHSSLAGSVKFSDFFQISTELGFQRKGNKYTNQYWDEQNNLVEDSTYLVRTNLDYVTLPLYLRLSLGRSSKFYFQAGGYYGYLFHANYTGPLLGEMAKKNNIIDGLVKHDLGILAGGGIETPIRQGLTVLLDIKYQWGLRDLNSDPLVTGTSKPLKNKGLAMGMGIMIDIE